MKARLSRITLPAANYNLEATFNSGQAFRWTPRGESWEGVVADRWVRLREVASGLAAETVSPAGDWSWLRHYLQMETDLDGVIRTFPRDAAMRAATEACGGLRLLRQEPWECLASFILSSTKQIVQIRQIIEELCRRLGRPIESPADSGIHYTFPTPGQVAGAPEKTLRDCKMGFRAPYLRAAAEMVVRGDLDLGGIVRLPLEEAREQLFRVPGVGPKIANCVLLFAYGFPQAFPVDVWIVKALRQLYFKRRKVRVPRLQKFAAEYFGPFSGYAQQYLFHYIRLEQKK